MTLGLDTTRIMDIKLLKQNLRFKPSNKASEMKMSY